MASKRMGHTAALQAQAEAAADASGQAAIAAAAAGRRAAVQRMKQKQAQLAPVKGEPTVPVAASKTLLMASGGMHAHATAASGRG